MATSFNFKDVQDLQMWRPESPAIGSSASGVCMASDLTNWRFRNPNIYLFRSATTLDAYNTRNGDWINVGSPSFTNNIGAGAAIVYHPSQGPRGLIATGASTTGFTLATALPGSVGVNTLANNGRTTGYRIRVIGRTAGKVEERNIIGNTTGSTPTVYLDTALSFTPTSSDSYEILGGRVFLINSGLTSAASVFKYYDVASNTFSSNLSVTNLPSTIGTDGAMVALSELHVPWDTVPGAGFLTGTATYNAASPIGCIQATAATNTTNATITGSGMPSNLFTNEFANFQIRIVEDSVNTGSVGQRIRISSHTSGATAVFTCSGTFATAPSSSAKFVVENDDDKIIFRSGGNTTTYTYNINSNAWDTTTFGASSSSANTGVSGFQAFGLSRDPNGNVGPRQIYFLRGGGSASIDLLSINAGTFSTSIGYSLNSTSFSTGTCAVYDPVTLGGRYAYINLSGTNRFMRFDLRTRTMEAYTYLRFSQGTAVVGNKMALGCMIDGNTKLSLVYHLTNTQAQMFSIACVDAPNQIVTTSPTVTTFTSTTSAQLASFNPARRRLIVYNEGAGILYVLFGSGTASTTNYTIQIPSGKYEVLDSSLSAYTAIFGAAGTARVTEIF